MLESSIENCVNAYAKHKFHGNILIRKMNGQGFRAWPDRVYLMPDRIFFIEYKQKGERPSKAQAWMHQFLANLGFRVYVVDDVQMGKDIVDAEADGEPLQLFVRGRAA